MKVELHIPVEQYGFVAVTYEGLTSEDQIRQMYNSIKAAFAVGDGIPDKEMDEVIYLMLKGETVRGGIEIYNRMDAQQQKECQRIKRLTKRINTKLKKENNE